MTRRYLSGDLSQKKYSISFGDSLFVVELEVGGGLIPKTQTVDSKCEGHGAAGYLVHRVRECFSMEKRSYPNDPNEDIEVLFEETKRIGIYVPMAALFTVEGVPKEVEDIPIPGVILANQ